MGLDEIIQRVMALQVSPALLANKKKSKYIYAEITAINEMMGKKVDGLMAILKGQGKASVAEVFDFLSTTLTLKYHELQSIRHHIDQINEHTKRLQEMGCGYFAMLYAIIFKKIEAYEKPEQAQPEKAYRIEKKLAALNDFCEANLTHLHDQIILRLKQENLYYSLKEYSRRFFSDTDDEKEVRKFYYAALDVTIKRFADINVHMKNLHYQHYIFTQLQQALYNQTLTLEQRESRFFVMFKNYLANDYPVPVQAMELLTVIVPPPSMTKHYLQTMQRHSEVFLQEVDAEMDRRMHRAGLYQTFEEYCNRSIATELYPNESVQQKTERLFNHYYRDRYRKINELASKDVEFHDMYLQHQEIVKLQTILNDTALSAETRSEQFRNHIVQQEHVLSRGFEPAAELWLKAILVLLAAIPTFGIGGYFAYQGLFSTTGSLFVENALSPQAPAPDQNPPALKV